MERTRFVAPAVIALVLAALTQSFYPYLYAGLLNVQPLELSLLTLRNIGEVVLLAVSVWILYESKPKATSLPHIHAGRVES